MYTSLVIGIAIRVRLTLLHVCISVYITTSASLRERVKGLRDSHNITPPFGCVIPKSGITQVMLIRVSAPVPTHCLYTIASGTSAGFGVAALL